MSSFKPLLRLFLFALLIGWWAEGTLTAASVKNPPNIIIFLADDLGYNDLSCFGHPRIKTPHLDQLARDGIRFTSFYAAAPVCSPSRVGLLTGRNPARAGVYDWIPGAKEPAAQQEKRKMVHLRQEEITLAKVLKDAGYATCMTGKWHCNSEFNQPSQPQPGEAGFDYWFATQNNAGPSHLNPRNFVRNGTRPGLLEGYSCQIVADEAVHWLNKKTEERPSQPFFLYIPFHEPHEPIASPPELVNKHLANGVTQKEAEYYANVENMDQAVGKVLASLNQLNLAENTLVLFTSDNGPETLSRYPSAERCYGSAYPLRGMKLWLAEGGIRVPAIIRWPAVIKPGRVCDQAVSALDLLPTIASLSNQKLPKDLQLDGMDITKILQGGNISRKEPLFWVYFNSISDERVAMRQGPWKLTARLNDGKFPKIGNITGQNVAAARDAKLSSFSLFHLEQDISEENNLADKEPRRLRKLISRMEKKYEELTGSMHVW